MLLQLSFTAAIICSLAYYDTIQVNADQLILNGLDQKRLLQSLDSNDDQNQGQDDSNNDGNQDSSNNSGDSSSSNSGDSNNDSKDDSKDDSNKDNDSSNDQNGDPLSGSQSSDDQSSGSGNKDDDDANDKIVQAQVYQQQSSNVRKGAKQNQYEKDDLKAKLENGEIQIKLHSIFPRGGPITGNTKVMVRASWVEEFVDIYTDPKCKFGTNDKIVDANYVKCTKKPLSFYEGEKSVVKNSTCVQCEDSPKIDQAQIISLQISLTGKFDDAYHSAPFRYYVPVRVDAIYPRYGPKDGDTVVQVWGDNFLDLGDDFRCNWGTRSTKAYFVSDNFIWCRSAPSDVVGKAMPFSVSLNRQQNSLQKIDYWYYNDPHIQKIIPDYGPVQGGTKIILKGSSFQPFDWKIDIDNQNDTFCMWGPLGKKPAIIISGTEAQCEVPANTNGLTELQVNLTLNNQNISEGTIFTYYNPPVISEATPLRGPVKGGTEVNVYGPNYDKNREVICLFGTKKVPAKVITNSHISCVSPLHEKATDVTLIVMYKNDRFQSTQMTYTYYDTAQIESITPYCGPTKGYTQIKVIGSSFIENNGFGKAKCMFNHKYYTNATVESSTVMYCDTPPLEYDEEDTNNVQDFYNVSVSADGEAFAKATVKFYFYDDPVIKSIDPWLGPMSGKTDVQILGKGFNQTNMCDFRIKFGMTEVRPKEKQTESVAKLDTLPVKIPGAVVVSITGNGQQYTQDTTLHYRDASNTFEYYQNFFVESIWPNQASNTGNTPILLSGILFDQFKFDNSSNKNVEIKCRFLDNSGNVFGGEIVMTRLTNSQYKCVAPKAAITEQASIELCVNGQQWQDTKQKVTFFNGPRVTSVNPTYGQTKNPTKQKIEITGDNFECPDGDCKNIKVRFTNKDGDEIIVDGDMTNGKQVVTQIPAYPAPETLTVDVSFNGIDYSNDNIQFGFIDPFILSVSPRLISAKGTSKLSIHGYGFVKTEDSKMNTYFRSEEKTLMCGDGKTCTKIYTVVNEKKSLVDTFPQSEVQKQDKTNIGFKPININIQDAIAKKASESTLLDISDRLKKAWRGSAANNIDLWYYKDPTFKSINSLFAYTNEMKPLIMQTDFSWNEENDFTIFRKWANFTCRFSSETSDKNIVTSAVMEVSQIGQFKKELLPDQIRCRTPKWDKSETVKLEISVNGQDYLGDYKISFVEPLVNLRISPLCGPISGFTKVSIYGTGINSSLPVDKPVFVKFGTLNSQQIDKTHVIDDDYNDEEYHSKFNMNKHWLKEAEQYWQPIQDGASLKKYMSAETPNIKALFQHSDAPDWRSMGGPVSIQMGESVPITITNQDSEDKDNFKTSKTDNIEVLYQDSSNLEFYFFRNPFIKKVEPNSGLITGGTTIDITGGWFDEKAEYGMFPFCKIGDHITRAKFIQTTRIQCNAPAAKSGTDQALPVEVSQNGVDFMDTGFTFSYYEKPILDDMKPRCGPIQGGTEIFLIGQKFSNITNGLKTVLCRFTQTPNQQSQDEGMDENKPPVRYMPAYFITGGANNTKGIMKCASPSGWNGGDVTKVDLTFNGVDYTDSSYQFAFYSYYGSFPKSGPFDGLTQYIQVRGKGFADEMNILCVLNGNEMAPISIQENLIKCPMVNETDYLDKAGKSVSFATKIDGSIHSFGNFFYYQQLTIDNVLPLIAPNDGQGAIYIIGRNFRDDYASAKPACRIGNTITSAQLLDAETIRCTIDKELPLIDDGESLLVTAALNSYSWGASDFSMHPYGILSLHPAAGPVGQNTNILVTGKGFNNDLKENARCKFGTDDNYAVVEGQVLDNEHMICKSPLEQWTLPENADEDISVPFAIAFQEDIYFPYTNGPQKFSLYHQPRLIAVEPEEIQVGKLTEVYITADSEYKFWQPIPPPGENSEKEEEYSLKCKFGRFGTAPAQFINSTTILCLTPSISDDPADISAEITEVTVAMNGVDFNEESQELTVIFVGTGAAVGVWVLILGTFIFALLIIALIFFLFGLQSVIAANRENKNFNDGQIQPYTRLTNAGPQLDLQQRYNRARATESAAAGGRFSRANGGSRSGPGGSRAVGSRAAGGSRALGSRQLGSRQARDNIDSRRLGNQGQ